MSKNYQHNETMAALGVKMTDLPEDLHRKVYVFIRKAANAKHPDKIEELEDESDRIAAEIVAWHDEDFIKNPTPPPPAPPVEPTPPPTPPVEPTPPPVEPTPPPVEPTPPPVEPTPPQVEPTPPPVQEKSGWSLDFLTDY